MKSQYDKIAYLERIKDIDKQIEELELQKKSLMITKQSAKAIRYDDMPHGNKQSDTSDFIVQISEIEERLEDKKALREDTKRYIQNCIDRSVKNSKENKVLTSRYIEMKPWKTIQEEIGRKRRQTFEIHRKALQHLVV